MAESVDRPNLDTETARRYERKARHSYTSIRSEPHFLDWDNQPSVYKVYENLPEVRLKAEWSGVDVPTLETMEWPPSAGWRSPPARLTLEILSRILFYSYGQTAKKTHPGVTYHLRAAPSAGALYPVELYMLVRSVQGIVDGIYHFDPSQGRLVRLREGDYAATIAVCCSRPEAVRTSSVTFLLSAIFWRSSWKYRARAYRYCALDSGHLAGNILVLASALGLSPLLIYNFLDGPINELLGLDENREAVFALVSLCSSPPGQAVWEPAEHVPRFPRIDPRYRPLSKREVAYPLINEMHQATRLLSPNDLPPASSVAHPQGLAGKGIDLPAVRPPSEPLGETLSRRRSSRDFSRTAIPLESFSAVMRASFGEIPSDLGGPLNLSPYLVVNAVGDLDPGVYVYRCDPPSLTQRAKDDFRTPVTYLCLEQELVGNSAAAIFFIADLDDLLSRYGNRGYRIIHIASGVIGEFIYLSTRSLAIGCSGIGAFYDDDILRFFGCDLKKNQIIYVVPFGVESPDRHLIS